MKILLAEDDARTASFVRKGLSEAGHGVEHVVDGRDALSFCLYNGCDLVVLDRLLPGMDGLAVLRALRAAGKETPVIFLTAVGDVEDRVEGLAAGADDYLVKPFHVSELLARIGALSRRGKAVPEVTTLSVHDLTLNLLTRTAKRQGQTIELQPREFALLEALMRNAGRVVTRTMLLERVWDYRFEPNTTVVETHVSRLRAKVDRPFAVALIHTVRSIGYTIRGPE